MGNKLREIFSVEPANMLLTFTFPDEATARSFQNAIKQVSEEGEPAEIQGTVGVTQKTVVGNHEMVTGEYETTSGSIVYPVYEPYFLCSDKSGLELERCLIKDGAILMTKKDAPLFLRIAINTDSKQINLRVEPHYENAGRIADIIDYIGKVQVFLDELFRNDTAGEENLLVREIKERFCFLKRLFEKIQFVEDQFSIKVKPTIIDLDDIESLIDLEELYQTVHNRKAIRLNKKIKEPVSEGVKMLGNRQIHIGDLIDLTSAGEMEFHLWGEIITIPSASIMFNGCVKDIIPREDGLYRVLYEEKESRPMFISYKGFMTEDEAKEECELIMEHREEYWGAKTGIYYLRQKEETVDKNG